MVLQISTSFPKKLNDAACIKVKIYNYKGSCIIRNREEQRDIKGGVRYLQRLGKNDKNHDDNININNIDDKDGNESVSGKKDRN
jgi:hypothetical protein